MAIIEQGIQRIVNLRDRFGSRAMYTAAAVLTAILLGGIGLFMTRPHLAPLFAAPLAEEQVAEIDGRLAAWGIAHDVHADGIDVDSARRDDIVVRLSMSGLPHQHVATSGETLAKMNALTPDALFQAQSRAGLEGDIAVALRAIDGIRDASIVIAPAVTAPFSDAPASPASASVRLTLRPGSVLTQGAIDGIRAFIAGGVAGLEPARITLLDDHGVALTASSRVAAAKGGETDAAGALQSALDEAFGSGAVIARVHTTYDTASHETHEIRRSALDGAAIHENEHREHLHGGARNYDRVDRENDRGSLTHEDISRRAAGNAVHTTVALFVNAESKLDIGRLRSLAAATVGLDLAHGDEIVVEPMPFVAQSQSGVNAVREAVAFVAPYNMYLFFILAAFGGFAARGHLLRGAGAVGARYREFSALRPASPSDAHAGEIHASLQAEPAYTAAAVLTSLPVPLRNAVLARYSIEERETLHRKMRAPVTHYASNM